MSADKEKSAQYVCDVCGATFKDPDALAKHKRVHSAGSEKPKDELETGTEPPMEKPSLPPSPPGPPIR